MSQQRAESLGRHPRPAPEPGPGVERRGRVLILEQDEALLGFESEALSSFRPGFAVATARSADHAAEWLDTFSPDLILIGLDGNRREALDGVSALLSDSRTRACKIVVLADQEGAGFLEPWVGARAQAVLSRSTGLPELLRTVRRLI